MNHVGERPADPLTLILYPVEGSGESALYEDAGDGFGYENGQYARRRVSCETTSERVTVRLPEREGSFAPPRERVVLELGGVTRAPRAVTADGAEPDWSHEEDVLVVRLSESAGETVVEVEL